MRKIISLIVIISLFSTLVIVDRVQAEYRPYDVEFLTGDKWEYRYTTSSAGMSMVISASLEVIGDNTIEIDGENYEVYVMQMDGSIDSVEMDTSDSEINLSFVEDYINSYTGTYYISKDLSVSKQILNMKFELLYELTQKTIDYETTTTTIQKETSGGKPEVINASTSWVSTTTSDVTQTMTVSGSFFEQIYGEGYTNTTTSSSNTTSTKNYECLSVGSSSVTAGTFDTYEIRSNTVGDDSYTIEYYSTDVKNNVKIVSYDSQGVLLSLSELLSYDLTSGTTTPVNNKGIPGFELILLVFAIGLVLFLGRKKLKS